MKISCLNKLLIYYSRHGLSHPINENSNVIYYVGLIFNYTII